MAKAKSAKDILRGRLEEFAGQRRKAAEYILARPGEVAVFSLRKVAARARVSPGTLVTLAKSVGHPSYNAFREQFQQDEIGILDYFSAGAKAFQAAESDAEEPAQLVEKVIRSDLNNVAELARGEQADVIREAAAAISRARNVYAIGRRATFGLAHYFYYMAQLLRENVHLVDDFAGMAGDQMARVGKEDVVVCCGFYPYIRSVLDLVDEAEARGAKIVSITDSHASPLARPDGLVIKLPVDSPWIFGSVTASTVVIQALTAQLAALGGEAVLERVKQQERLLGGLKVFAL